jgi:hypothetical protein
MPVNPAYFLGFRACSAAQATTPDPRMAQEIVVNPPVIGSLPPSPSGIPAGFIWKTKLLDLPDNLKFPEYRFF